MRGRVLVKVEDDVALKSNLRLIERLNLYRRILSPLDDHSTFRGVWS